MLFVHCVSSIGGVGLARESDMFIMPRYFLLAVKRCPSEQLAAPAPSAIHLDADKSATAVAVIFPQQMRRHFRHCSRHRLVMCIGCVL